VLLISVCSPTSCISGGIPICVCDLDAAGLTCNLHSQSGLLELTPSADHSAESGERTDIAIRFAKPFASPPKLSDVNGVLFLLFVSPSLTVLFHAVCCSQSRVQGPKHHCRSRFGCSECPRV
jgi:hypothetical protein